MKKLIFSAAVLAASVSFFSCNTSKTKCTDKDIEGAWTLTSVAGTNVTEADSVYLNFTKAFAVNGMTGCNRIFGEYKIDGDILTFDKLGSTRMACPNDQLETKVLSNIGETATFAIKDCDDAKKTTLTFFDKNKKEIMTFKKK